jgi:CheY-like chemotaxis protein
MTDGISGTPFRFRAKHARQQVAYGLYLPRKKAMKEQQHVLVVEDDPDVRELVGECLYEQCAVTLVENGPAALDVIAGRPEDFDALVVDLEMPQMDGTELIEELHHRDIHLPTLILSATPEAPQRAQQAHADFLAKPFDVPCLQEKVGRLLRVA